MRAHGIVPRIRGVALALYAQHAPSVVVPDVNMVRRFLEFGAMGYILTQRPREEFRQALRESIGQLAV